MDSTIKSRVHLAFDVVESKDKTADGHKTPIIFIHGIAAAKETWYEVIRPIADATGRKAYAYDARNHGDSGWSDEFGFEYQQDDLLGFMDSIRAKKSVLVGHSSGGAVAMLFALDEPERVDKLVIEDMPTELADKQILLRNKEKLQLMEDIVDTIPPDIKDLDEAKYFVHEAFRGKNAEYRSGTKLGDTAGSSLPIRQDETGKFCWKINFKAFAKYLAAPLPTANGVFPGPTLMLYGTKSPFKVYEDRENTRKLFPNSRFRAVEGARHWIHEKFPEAFVKEVVEFLNES